ncbi:MAG: hypothetical protein ACFFES_00320 [Candidatus Thorarchaeota archaeon]
MIASNDSAMRGKSRGSRRKRPIVVKELIRIGAGPAMLYLIAGSDRALKIRRDDVKRLEVDSGKRIEEMYETELTGVMERLGIQALSLNEDEGQIVRLASKYVLAGYFLLTENE